MQGLGTQLGMPCIGTALGIFTENMTVWHKPSVVTNFTD